MQENKSYEHFNFKVSKNEPDVLNFLHDQFKLHKGSKTDAIIQTFKDNIAMKKAIIELKKENEELRNNGSQNNLNGGQPLSQSTTETPFDYEKWYSDCEYGTYFKDKKKVHCRCTYPSVKKWLPKNRMVDPQICDNCFPRVQGIDEWVKTQREEKKALNHTKPFFTNEYGQRIAY